MDQEKGGKEMENISLLELSRVRMLREKKGLSLEEGLTVFQKASCVDFSFVLT